MTHTSWGVDRGVGSYASSGIEILLDAFQASPRSIDTLQPKPSAEGPRISAAPAPRHYLWFKRLLDIAVALVVMALVALPLGICILLIRLDSPGSAIFRQRRVGKGGKEFTCFKLRTMAVAESPDTHRTYLEYIIGNSSSVVATHMPARSITRLGRLLRKLSIDEIPQLVNVLRGEMSLVGPRPPIPYEVACYQPWHLQRLEVTPGMTGYWQVKGRARVTFDEMCAMDITYINRRSVFLDLKILAQTPLAALRGSG